MRIGVNLYPASVALAEAKKPEHYQYYDNQTNNINESIHDFTYEVVGRARLQRRCCVVCTLAHISARRGGPGRNGKKVWRAT
jgi:hypothetical protein